MSDYEFVECAVCAAQVGSPALCPSCLQNRSTISRMQKRIAQLETVVGIARDVLSTASSTEPRRPS